MKAIILDTRTENGSRCYLCRIVLDEYISELPAAYREYPIQREIVKNIYLDDLVKTVLLKKHIPPIVLVVEDGNYEPEGQTLNIKDFKILDGLQRTHRLKVIYDTALFYKELNQADKAELAKMSRFEISRKYSSSLRNFGSNTDTLSVITEFAGQSENYNVLESFEDNFQWFEVWTNLTLKQEVQKMLVLNAGHKPVNTRHQLELLFLNILPSLGEMGYPTFTIVREKEQSATTYSKRRVKGQFHFAHLIASILSYSAGRPITTNTSLIQSLQNEPAESDYRSEVLDFHFLERFVSFLLNLDQILEVQFGRLGTQWLGREVALVGLLGALGNVRMSQLAESAQPLEAFLEVMMLRPGILNLEAFEEERNNLDLRKVNIGNINKTSVYKAVLDLMLSTNPERINWKKYFEGSDV